MVLRKFVVEHGSSAFDVDYDTDDGFEVLKFQLFSLTSIPPDQQKIIRSDDNHMVLEDYDLESVCNKLRLVSIEEDENAKEVEKPVADFVTSDEELARMLQAEEEALMMQQFVTSENREQVEQKIRPYLDQVLMYEDTHRQEAARKTVPVDKLEEKAMVALAREGNCNPTKDQLDHAFLLQLLYWFKQSFRFRYFYRNVLGYFIIKSAEGLNKPAEEPVFPIPEKFANIMEKTVRDFHGRGLIEVLTFILLREIEWVNAPPCDSCNSETVNQGMGVANHSELLYGASRVEVYRCKSCMNQTRFPRYNDPLKLLETRRGRCGEWANCFTLYCRAFGYESRLILDLTDHVWTECFSPYLGRWMHLDPCEGIYDNPLLYEKGWGKKLNYVIGIAKDGVYDVTKRYTRKWHEVLSRRVITTEPTLANIISDITKERRKTFSNETLLKLEERDKNEVDELERALFSKDDASISLPGRQSGDKEWRISRSEFGSGDHSSLSSSSCPVRKCVDEHVTKIYNAFFPIISQLLELAYDISSATEMLESFKRILVTLKNSPFKARRTTINAVSANSLFGKMLPSFGQLFDALSLRTKSGVDGATDIRSASDPVKTSLALPVAFHALDDLIHNLNCCEKLNKESLSWPLLKLNRICSGFVLASGEELPFGIATCAFDGTRLSKWEEPNGATGCWIIYKVVENRMHKLIAYELMSANDAPERDPMDWILEGSEDGGSNWHVLDEQTSQIFSKRFQRKTFTVEKSRSFVANTFRFRFLSVRDAKSTSRFQIGSIDLFASTDDVHGLE
ncbi:peptide-N(4)-(N-acetyl-beta-glucosaminyl) asparagine amidase [Striga asiatica]|uniref:Peptide-N(4)-(N-acetyl-beta-glucosaminyl) asparagine amidase n=1 Tax=Striga asiatica TaxID=4170 RepID=A0A5A7RDN8_STRAF|nr:peptide-N(4)-(N-acetyl-beta-glucosaminyl) asparagine amidase [Striga asiatica]